MKSILTFLVALTFSIHSTAQDWQPCGSGTNDYVQCLLSIGQDIYVAGGFSTPGRRIAIYHPSTDTWDSLNGGVNGFVTCMTRDGDYLYVGGSISVPFVHIGRYNLITKTWEDLNPFRLINQPNVMIVVQGKLFASHGQGQLSYYDLSQGVWSGVPDKPDATVETFAWDGSYLYMGGRFMDKGKYITRLSLPGNVWDDCNGGVDATVHSLIIYNNLVYVGGDFKNRGSAVAVYNPATDMWSTLDTGVGGRVFALDADNQFIYAGGEFSGVGNSIARFDLSDRKWKPLDDMVGSNGVDGRVESICHSNNTIYAGGWIFDKGDFIAKWTVPLSVPTSQSRVIAKIYPNPASEVLHISVAEPLKDARVAIFDATGKLVLSQTFGTIKDVDINVADFGSGLYFLAIRSTEGVVTRRFAKAD